MVFQEKYKSNFKIVKKLRRNFNFCIERYYIAKFFYVLYYFLKLLLHNLHFSHKNYIKPILYLATCYIIYMGATEVNILYNELKKLRILTSL